MAFHYGSEADRAAAGDLQKQLLYDDSKDCGILNRVVRSMKDFHKHDKRIPKQERRESRAYAVDMVKTLHVLLRVYERLCRAPFTVTCGERAAPSPAAARTQAAADKQELEGGAEGEDSGLEADGEQAQGRDHAMLGSDAGAAAARSGNSAKVLDDEASDADPTAANAAKSTSAPGAQEGEDVRRPSDSMHLLMPLPASDATSSLAV
jgi:hypothetical protein